MQVTRDTADVDQEYWKNIGKEGVMTPLESRTIKELCKVPKVIDRSRSQTIIDPDNPDQYNFPE